MVVELDNETAIVEADFGLDKVFEEVVGDGATSDVFEEYLHRRLVLKHAVLSIESEMCCMQVDNEGWRIAGMLVENVRIGDD